MCRTIVGISANLCPVDEDGKNIHTSVSRKFVDGVRMAGGLPMVIPLGDKSLVEDYLVDRMSIQNSMGKKKLLIVTIIISPVMNLN